MSKYQMELPIVKFNKKGFALSDGWVQVYRASEYTREYTGTDITGVFATFGLPAGAYLDKPEPPPSDNMAICRAADGKSWIHVPDFRGRMAYHTQTRQHIEIKSIGELPPELTFLAPQTLFDQWNGKQWVTDIAAQYQYERQQVEKLRTQLRQQAEAIITPLLYALDTELATEDEKQALIEWKKYLVALSRLDISEPMSITWPEQPNVAA
ncbi:tail assembly chaperone [Xenorhabdus beddingii]|uniref:Tail assembly chaperone n=1 Tax=Xenorhabdus beddingii TaxID=40578 RepID=A0A1Y2SH44_9GAMM|nr:tail fiber assembly protein [Xenorhabdus beddingii]OTA17188.1 tail assembly chaperone [Xenorhabdus beddingii]